MFIVTEYAALRAIQLNRTLCLKAAERLHQDQSRISIGTTSADSVDSDRGCTSRIYFDNVTLAVIEAMPRQ